VNIHTGRLSSVDIKTEYCTAFSSSNVFVSIANSLISTKQTSNFEASNLCTHGDGASGQIIGKGL